MMPGSVCGNPRGSIYDDETDGPKGPLFGRGYHRNWILGPFNRGKTRVGWSYYKRADRQFSSLHGSRRGARRPFHHDILVGPRGPAW